MMLKCGWSPNTTYIEVLARERQSQTNRNQQQSNSHSYYLLRKATFRLRWPAGRGWHELLLLSGM